MIGQTPIFSASEFVAVFNQTIEMMYPVVGITGELSSFRVSKGTWVYFDLKDDGANVKFFGTVRQLPGPLEDGMNLEVLGRPYLHPRFGFSIQIMSVRAVGEGTIKKAQDLLMAKLQGEGLFDDARKRLLPYPPERIALVASSESAAYSDFMKITRARWPMLQTKLFNVQVQGQDSVAQLVQAVEDINQTPDLFDALVMIRGGGSAEDLAAFSAESVVRAVAASRVPTVVAIGHERDVSLAELAADLRASTPSNAAELLVPDRNAEQNWLKTIQKQINGVLSGRFEQLETETKELGQGLDRALERTYRATAEMLLLKTEMLRLLNPGMPLQRGFALVRGSTGQLIRKTKQAKARDSLTITVSDGTIAAKVRG
jgi:exodeoxyribonuclease VII large subunit